MLSIVAQTMVRQLISVVNTSIWEVALANVAEETFDRIGRSDVSVQRLRKVIKGQCLVFLLG
jgi:hypothetical protein